MAKPDVVLIVLDCVRAGTVDASSLAAEKDSALGQFFRECVSFPRAVSSSPWTLPSHATILTGWQPWEHGVHFQGGGRLPPSVQTLAQHLEASGYATIGVSENPMISPATGLTRGFGSLAWGSALRWITGTDSTPTPPNSMEPGQPASSAERNSFDTMAFLSAAFYMFPLATAAIQRITGGRSTRAGGWVREFVRRRLKSVPKDQPMFLFANINDAHEPYLHIDPQRSSFGERLWFLMTPQSMYWNLGHTGPVSPQRAENLESGYQRTVDASLRRAAAILEEVRRRGNWDNTLVVIMGDHGQALGEHDWMFHHVKVYEEIIRIPLFVKFPGGESAGREARGWAGLVDVWPTVAALSGAPMARSADGHDLRSLIEVERPEPIVAAGDGLRNRAVTRWLLGRRYSHSINLTYGVAYQGDLKAVAEASSGEVSVSWLSNFPEETVVPRTAWDGAHSSLASRASSVAASLRPDGRPLAEMDPVLDRLQAWGYV